jgi:allantoin racemase
MPRLLVINPNTTDALTDRVAEAGRALLPGTVEMVTATGRFGARYISDLVSFTIAGHAALDCFATWQGKVDGVLLACFGDPGLLALKELAGVPVIGMAEASFAAAAEGGRRFAIVTGGVRWKPVLERLAEDLGFGSSLAGIETLTLTGGQIAADPAAAVRPISEACRAVAASSGADNVILGGAGLVGLRALVQPHVDVPLLCSVEAGFQAAAAMLAKTPAAKPGPRHLPSPSRGLSSDLARVLAGEG